jgi:hypothetical protein
MKKIFILSLSAMLAFVSCNNENTDISKDTPTKPSADFLKLFSSDAENNILVESIGSLYSDNRIENVTTRTKEGRQPVSLSINGKKLTSSVDENASQSIKAANLPQSLFGKTVSLKINDGNLVITPLTENSKMTTSALASNATMYVPEPITANINKLSAGKIVPGTVINWNKDPNNKNGVVVVVQYNPALQPSTAVARANTEIFTRYLDLSDSGSYTVTAADLKNFPNESSLSFYIGRMAYAVTTDGSVSNDTSLGIYTAVRSDFDIAY